MTRWEPVDGDAREHDGDLVVQRGGSADRGRFDQLHLRLERQPAHGRLAVIRLSDHIGDCRKRKEQCRQAAGAIKIGRSAPFGSDSQCA